MRLNIIVAMGENNEIGMGGRMPFHFMKHMSRLVHLTEKSICIISNSEALKLTKPRSIPSLPGRHILSTGRAGCTLNRAIGLARHAIEVKGWPEDIWVLGGERLFREALPLASRVFMTYVHWPYPGADAFFPELDLSTRWEITTQLPAAEDVEGNMINLDFMTWERKT